MPPTLYGLSASHVERLKQLLDRVESGDLLTSRSITGKHKAFTGTVTGLLESAVSATTALTGKPKVGTLNVYSFSSTGTVDTGADLSVFNFAPAQATTDRWTRCAFDITCGQWVIDTQYCS